ncbi:dihydrofolate reductase [Pedobacter sp. MC2016-24]|uniref:dihydrofolate reductase n=1 Tax=Pedobacter sp. MC2016-24 TaxID=2780090 RepID=UPI00187EF807|nr:dihydrofolate reductase [Pedobacter sp. MC2016-24]MBE9601776.1 dihydrofolate reductase [Pedobacter sp. MC2016-24]
MIVSAVVAIAENYAIGKNNELLWYLPADLKHFKAVTSGHTVIMGRKTYESIGKPLPNRRNVVVTRKKDLLIPGVEITNGIDEALLLCSGEPEVFIIGGAEIYKSALERTDRIYLTTVHDSFEADAYFPEIDRDQWRETEIEKHLPDEKNKLAYTFSTLLRK